MIRELPVTLVLVAGLVLQTNWVEASMIGGGGGYNIGYGGSGVEGGSYSYLNTGGFGGSHSFSLEHEFIFPDGIAREVTRNFSVTTTSSWNYAALGFNARSQADFGRSGPYDPSIGGSGNLGFGDALSIKPKFHTEQRFGGLIYSFAVTGEASVFGGYSGAAISAYYSVGPVYFTFEVLNLTSLSESIPQFLDKIQFFSFRVPLDDAGRSPPIAVGIKWDITSKSGWADLSFYHTIKPISIVFEENGKTPESLGYDVIFESGMQSPNLSPVPEPASLTLVGLGAFGLIAGAIRRRRQTKQAAHYT